MKRALVITFTALASMSASAAPQVLALIVGNNQSRDADRPDLRYADDDALKYAQLFDTIAPKSRVEVLTRIDPTSAPLYAERETRPPTTKALRAAVRNLANAARMAREAGDRPELYFVFAGHGDSASGEGWLELEDAAIGRDALAAILDEVGAARSHVLLDSCNSFLVINPRRPGGEVRRVRPVARGLRTAERDVGVFLSTSAEAQVFEWSKFQSGVFSHAVRSGLFGAADLDGDRRVTYRELASFVRVASSGIKNADLRPQVYLDEPGEGAVLLDLRGAEGRPLELVGFTGRATIRDPNGVRLLDVDAAPGFSPQLVLPKDVAYSVIAELVDVDGRRRLFDVKVGRDAQIKPPISLSSTRENPVGSSSWTPRGGTPRGGTPRGGTPRGGTPRGGVPFGDPAATTGLDARADGRVGRHLGQLSRAARTERLGGAVVSGVGATAMAVAGGALMVSDAVSQRTDTSSAGLVGATYVGAGLLLAATAGIAALVESDLENIASSFEEAPGETPADRLARSESARRALEVLAHEAEADRQASAWTLGAIGALEVIAGGAMLVYPATAPGDPGGDDIAVLGGLTLTLGALGLGAAVVQLSERSWVENSLELIEVDLLEAAE